MVTICWEFVNDHLIRVRKKTKPSLNTLKMFLDHVLCLLGEILTFLMYAGRALERDAGKPGGFWKMSGPTA